MRSGPYGGHGVRGRGNGTLGCPDAYARVFARGDQSLVLPERATHDGGVTALQTESRFHHPGGDFGQHHAATVRAHRHEELLGVLVVSAVNLSG